MRNNRTARRARRGFYGAPVLPGIYNDPAQELPAYPEKIRKGGKDARTRHAHGTGLPKLLGTDKAHGQS